MEVLHLNTRDKSGGASRAAYRLHKQLRMEGIDSKMLVQHKHGDDPSVLTVDTRLSDFRGDIRSKVDSLRIKQYPDRKGDVFSPGIYGKNIAKKVNKIDPDIVHLHWISEGFVKINCLENIDAPLVWTLHDMWPFTGGCHYSNGCTRYRNNCGKCPYLGSDRQADLSHRILELKKEHWSGIQMNIVTPSEWLANQARTSIFEEKPISVIPNGVDINHFSPRDGEKAKDLYSLPDDKKLILFGAFNTTNPRKGYGHLRNAIRKVDPRNKALVTYGHGDPPPEIEEKFDVYHIGHVDDLGLALLYAAADVMVVPSIEDNLPNTILEALACGTPCVAFDIGGIPDMVNHMENGYLAKPSDPVDLSQGINWVLEGENNRQNLSKNARRSAKDMFNIEETTREYSRLYKNIH